jgi:hypothetical protein
MNKPQASGNDTSISSGEDPTNPNMMSTPMSTFKVERFECGDEVSPSITLSHEDESSYVHAFSLPLTPLQDCSVCRF